MRVEVVCTSNEFESKMAIKAKAKAFRSTYLDIGLRHIGRQSAHDDLAGGSRGCRGWVSDLRRSLRGSGRLLHSTDGGGLSSGATVATTASILAAVADEVIQ